MMGVGATAQMALLKRGIAPAEPLAVVLSAIETLGGLCIALGLVMFAIALRGGGPYSLDRVIGREL